MSAKATAMAQGAAERSKLRRRIAELEADNARLTALLKAAMDQIDRDAKGIAELVGVNE